MTEELPSEFDFIVIGTGMTESILAAAFARIGHSVLHIDRNDHYSGQWASFNLEGIEKLDASQNESATGEANNDTFDNSLLKEGEKLLELPSPGNDITDISMMYHVDEETEQSREKRKDEVENSGNALDLGENKDCERENTDQQTNDADDAMKESFTETPEVRPGMEDVSTAENVSEKETENSSDKVDEAFNLKDTIKSWTVTSIKKEWRRFNLDLAPRILYSSGDMVDLLIQSDIAKYCEFKTVSRVLTMLNDSVEKVPCSRADVFASKKVSMIEKRMLMKFLTLCGSYEQHPEEYEEHKSSTFKDFLIHKKLTGNLRHFIQYSIAMVTDSASTVEGLERAKKYLLSLGRYGNTAFLWPLYGSGELPQAFCRMCAVFGGVYCLKTTASSLVVDGENKYQGLVTDNGQLIRSKWLIMESSCVPNSYMEDVSNDYLSRAILMTDKSVLTSDGDELSLMFLPDPSHPERPVTVLELPPSAQVCPRDMCIVHLSRKGVGKPENDLQFVKEALFDYADSGVSDKPKILWSLFLSQRDTSSLKRSSEIPDNVFVISGPGPEVDIDRPVREAQDLFCSMLPGEEFLPKAPNPEDIIYVDDTEAAASTEKSDLMENEKESETSLHAPDTEKEVEILPHSIETDKEAETLPHAAGTEKEAKISPHSVGTEKEADAGNHGKEAEV